MYIDYRVYMGMHPMGYGRDYRVIWGLCQSWLWISESGTVQVGTSGKLFLWVVCLTQAWMSFHASSLQ